MGCVSAKAYRAESDRVAAQEARILFLQKSLAEVEKQLIELEQGQSQAVNELSNEKTQRTNDRARVAHTLSLQHEELVREKKARSLETETHDQLVTELQEAHATDVQRLSTRLEAAEKHHAHQISQAKQVTHRLEADLNTTKELYKSAAQQLNQQVRVNEKIQSQLDSANETIITLDSTVSMLNTAITQLHSKVHPSDKARDRFSGMSLSEDETFGWNDPDMRIAAQDSDVISEVGIRRLSTQESSIFGEDSEQRVEIEDQISPAPPKEFADNFQRAVASTSQPTESIESFKTPDLVEPAVHIATDVHVLVEELPLPILPPPPLPSEMTDSVGVTQQVPVIVNETIPPTNGVGNADTVMLSINQEDHQGEMSPLSQENNAQSPPAITPSKEEPADIINTMVEIVPSRSPQGHGIVRETDSYQLVEGHFLTEQKGVKPEVITVPHPNADIENVQPELPYQTQYERNPDAEISI
eukprot:m.129987 g.129987  ORF g.129987 m.129987 type:complete len:472 (-) comp14590_c0_seq1:1178-2593(-)